MDRPELSPLDRRALAAVAAQFFVNGAMTASFIARAPQIRDRIDVGVDHYGVLLTVAGVFGLLGSALAGRIVEWLGTFRVLAIGGAVMVVALPLVGGARSPVWFLAALLVYVFVDVLVDISMNLQGSWISARRHTPVMNRLHGVWSLGTFAGGLGAAAANAAGLSLPAHLAIAAAASAAMLLFVLRQLLRTDEEGHDDTRHLPVVEPVGRRARLLPLALLVAGGMFAVTMETTPGDWAAFRLTDDFAASAAFGSAAFVAYTVGMTVVRFGGDWLQLRLGRGALHRWSVGVASAGLVMASIVPNRWIALSAFVLVGGGVATFLPKLYDDAARLPGRRGAGLGAMTSGTRVATLAAPSIVGLIAGTELSVGAAIAIVALPCSAGFVVVTRVSDRLLAQRRTAGVEP